MQSTLAKWFYVNDRLNSSLDFASEEDFFESVILGALGFLIPLLRRYQYQPANVLVALISVFSHLSIILRGR